MKEGVRYFCAFLSTAALAMAVLSSLGAITTGTVACTSKLRCSV